MRLRWGICGTGRICHDFVQALKLLPTQEHQVTVVGERSLKIAQQFAKDLGVLDAVGSYEELMQRPDIDIIYVGLVNIAHKNNVLLALDNGKHVLCEKPMGLSVKEVQEMVDKSRKKNLFLMEAFWSRFFPLYRTIKGCLDNKEIGDARIVTATLGYNMRKKAAPIQTKEVGAGATLSIGCYCTLMSSFVFGTQNPKQISAVGFLNEHGTDETSSVTMVFHGDKIFQFVQSTAMDLDNRAIITGTEGQITINEPFWCPTEATINGRVHRVALPDRGGLNFNYEHAEGLSYEAEAVRKCIVEGQIESDLMPLDESIHLAKINDEILRQLGVHY